VTVSKTKPCRKGSRFASEGAVRSIARCPAQRRHEVVTNRRISPAMKAPSSAYFRMVMSTASPLPVGGAAARMTVLAAANE
jgi:hypothetical protein